MFISSKKIQQPPPVEKSNFFNDFNFEDINRTKGDLFSLENNLASTDSITRYSDYRILAATKFNHMSTLIQRYNTKWSTIAREGPRDANDSLCSITKD
ncbi:hypothetical protein AKO1_011419 [Acrasis kona]|uniref:Uncharacterized protein n=1 Tax=Acrasis kona TaxID=1008807 RepID=A0AAW2ZII8_9EUKA